MKIFYGPPYLVSKFEQLIDLVWIGVFVVLAVVPIIAFLFSILGLNKCI